ncbi:MAG: hypothetical protein ACR2H1_01340 [Limisphaerales bacterium]
MGEPFKNKNLEIVWEATNQLPKTLNVYKVLPSKFSSEVISNVIAMCEFKNPTQAEHALLPVLEGKNASFESLSISPERGEISYFNSKVIALPRQPVEGVPSVEETLKLSLKILGQLDIDKSQIARKPGNNEFLFWRDERVLGGRVEGKYIKRETARGIYLIRAVDGIRFNGIGFFGGLYVNFGNNARIAQIDFVWRNLELKRQSPVADKKQIMQWIKDGKAALVPGEDISFNPASIKKLAITKIIPFYFGKNGMEVQNMVYPAAEIIAKINDTTNLVSLTCPIVK